MSPDDSLNCLLVQPRFAADSFWNYLDLATAMGAKAIAPPLGLLTVASLVPSHWKVKLVDLNVREVTAAEWGEADVVCTGGMLPQQTSTLEVIRRARELGVYVVVGGADPSSQPELYASADAVVVGEGEAAIPKWLESWRRGEPRGRFEAGERPDLTSSPIPRFDLICFDDYVNPGIQLSRGCPFNCEFCDIIELYGRKPRSKTSAQFLAELDRLYELGYRGMVDLVDDNLIGNKQRVKSSLAALAEWSRARAYPFYFSIEATLNLADDDELLRAMADANVRFVFVGIETPDPELLIFTQKSVNALRPLHDRIEKIYRRGMTVTAGFILGFDKEKPRADLSMVACIEDASIAIAMVGLLVALPNTQLTRRLQSEGRLINADLSVFEERDEPYRLATQGTYGEAKDNQAAGLNFITSRDRIEIYEEYRRVLSAIFSPKSYMDRVLASARRLHIQRPHRPASWWQLRRELRALLATMWRMTRNRETRRYYWRNTWKTLLLGSSQFDVAQTLMAMYLHLDKQSRKVCAEISTQIEAFRGNPPFPRSVGETSETSRAAIGGSR